MRKQDILGLVVLAAAVGPACHHVQPSCDRSQTNAHSALAWGPAVPDTADVRGRVVAAQTGSPLASAYVTIEPGHHTVSTDSAGRFRIPPLPNGRYFVRVRLVGHEEAHDSVTSGFGGLRLYAALAHGLGIIEITCTTSTRADHE